MSGNGPADPVSDNAAPGKGDRRMKLVVNGSEKEFSGVETLGQLIERLYLEGAPAGIAVAVNDTVVPRDNWASSRLQVGDTVEVIQAVQGG